MYHHSPVQGHRRFAGSTGGDAFALIETQVRARMFRLAGERDFQRRESRVVQSNGSHGPGYRGRAERHDRLRQFFLHGDGHDGHAGRQARQSEQGNGRFHEEPGASVSAVIRRSPGARAWVSRTNPPRASATVTGAPLVAWHARPLVARQAS